MMPDNSDCTCPQPIKPWREARPHRDCPVHGDVDERIDAMKERRFEREDRAAAG